MAFGRPLPRNNQVFQSFWLDRFLNIYFDWPSEDMVNGESSENDDREKADRIAKVECPNCGKKVHAYRVKKGRVMVTTTGGLVTAGVGGAIGSVFGIATAGLGWTATIPFGAVGLVIGSGLGYIVGDQLDDTYCPNCEETIKLDL